jgi:CheY-like chemotaxis protein
MPIQILIAENDPGTLDDIRQWLEKKEFETILARTPEEAKQIVDNNPLLGAYVIDRRLRDDDNPNDESGWDLAKEAQENGVANAPVIVFSTFAPSTSTNHQLDEQQTNGRVPRLIELSKADGLEVLVSTILEEIRIRLRQVPDLEDIPRYHQPPTLLFSANNGIGPMVQELKKSGVTPEILQGPADLQRAMTIYPSALVAVNVSGAAGLEAIDSLNKNQDIPNQNFYIVAIASDDKLREQASQAGVNATVIRQSPEADARELNLLTLRYKTAMATKQVKEGTSELYQQLLAQLKSRGDASASLDTIERALNWPTPTPNEKLILVTVHTRLVKAGETELDSETRALCIEGASLLAGNQARDTNVQDWMDRAARQSADFTFAWIDDESFSGDLEEND